MLFGTFDQTLQKGQNKPLFLTISIYRATLEKNPWKYNLRLSPSILVYWLESNELHETDVGLKKRKKLLKTFSHIIFVPDWSHDDPALIGTVSVIYR